MKNYWTVVLGVTLLSCLLGICLDLVTANVAVEYFSVHHPTVIESENPWVLAMIWGVGASWWFGAITGLVLATLNHYRKPKPLGPRRILNWTAIACGVLWLLMIAVLVGIYLFAEYVPEAKRTETFEHDRRLIAVAMAHQYEYILGGIALAILAVLTWRAKEQVE